MASTRIRIWGIVLAIVLLGAACDSSPVTTSSRPVTVTQGTPGVNAGPAAIATQHAGVYFSTATSDGDIPLCPDPPEGVIIEPAPTQWYLETTDLWVDVPLATVGRAMKDASHHSGYRDYLELGSGQANGMDAVLNASSVVAQNRFPGPFESWIFISGWDQLVDFESDGVALVGLEGFDPETAALKWVITPAEDGGFAVSGYCNAVRQFAAIGVYADAIDAEPYSAFRAIVSDDEEQGAFTAWLARR